MDRSLRGLIDQNQRPGPKALFPRGNKTRKETQNKMTEQKERTLEDFTKYQYGALAARLAQSKEGDYAQSALEVLAGANGLNLGEEALGFVKGAMASKDGINTATNIYNGKFEEKRKAYKPLELAGWYSSVLSDLGEDERKAILMSLGEHDETLESITQKIEEARYIIKAPEKSGLVTPEQRVQAVKTIKKYNNVYAVLQTLDKYKFESLRPDAVNATRKSELNGLAKKLMGSEEEE